MVFLNKINLKNRIEHNQIVISDKEVEYLDYKINLFKKGGFLNETACFYFLSKNNLVIKKTKFLRVLDCVLATFFIFLSLPIFLSLFIYSKIKFPEEPILFTHCRLGRNFQVFRVYKLRSMSGRVGKKLSVNKEDLAYPLKKIVQDPRSNSYGKFIRKWKIDELPQLFNVLEGNMSIVGPRPLSIEDSLCCPKAYIERFQVLPGMTGLWQSSFDNSIDYKKKFRLDSFYAKKISLKFYLYCLFNTFNIVSRGEKVLTILSDDDEKSSNNKKAS